MLGERGKIPLGHKVEKIAFCTWVNLSGISIEETLSRLQIFWHFTKGVEGAVEKHISIFGGSERDGHTKRVKLTRDRGSTSG